MNLLNYFIKNETVYIGNIQIKFEKYPNYTNGSHLNKIHLDLRFFKIVSRLKPLYDTNNNKIIDPDKIRLINKYTMGEIKNINDKPCFVSLDGKYVGNPEVGWRYYQENLIVCFDKPYGVAVKLLERKKVHSHLSTKTLYRIFMEKQFADNNVIGYLAYSHRGGTLFKIGDRIFDPYYIPKETDYDIWEWAGYIWECDDNGDEVYEIINHIPFNRLGTKEIKTFDQALTVATNLVNYLN